MTAFNVNPGTFSQLDDFERRMQENELRYNRAQWRQEGLELALDYFGDSVALVSTDAVTKAAAVFAEALEEGVDREELELALRIRVMGEGAEGVVARARAFSAFLRGEVSE